MTIKGYERDKQTVLPFHRKSQICFEFTPKSFCEKQEKGVFDYPMNGRKIYSDIRKQGFDCALFLDEISQFYLSDFHSTDGFCILSEKETAMFVDARYFEAAERAKANGELSDDVNIHLFKGDVYSSVKEFLHSIGGKKCALDMCHVSVNQARKLETFCPHIEFDYLSEICLEHRKVKTEIEIEKIKKAQTITDKAFEHILGFINENRTEIEIAAELEYFMRKNGADGLAFETIAVSGRNSSLPHGVPSTENITKNSFLTMDFGAKFGGYCSDMTRTVVLGKADEEMKHVYNTVLTAQEESMKFIRAGVSCKDADAVARKVIADAGYGEYFSHSLGHSLGLEIHEAPSASPRSNEILKSGQIITVEPGIYIPNKFGVRIENMVLVTENDCENLTQSSKELIEI